MLPDTKQRKMLLARWWALAVICCMWFEGDKSEVMVIPRSLHWVGCGSSLPLLPIVLGLAYCEYITFTH